jgi:hypothetical protein
LKTKGRETGFSTHKAVNILKINPLKKKRQKAENGVQSARIRERQIVAGTGH